MGILVRAALSIEHIRTHVFDVDEDGVVSSRDCCEYHLTGPDGPLVVLVNHFTSKGDSEPGDRLGAERRRRQAERVAEVYRGPRDGGADVPGHRPRDISAHPDFESGPRRGTFQGGNEPSEFDDVLLSPDLFAAATSDHAAICADVDVEFLRTYTSSIRAISAASPWRAPSFRMRV